MNLYFISQNQNTGYDTYDSAVVVAKNEEEAKLIYPSVWREQHWSEEKQAWLDEEDELDLKLGREIYIYNDYSWTNPKDVKVELIGKAVPGLKAGDVICSSFNAG